MLLLLKKTFSKYFTLKHRQLSIMEGHYFCVNWGPNSKTGHQNGRWLFLNQSSFLPPFFYEFITKNIYILFQ